MTTHFLSFSASAAPLKLYVLLLRPLPAVDHVASVHALWLITSKSGSFFLPFLALSFLLLLLPGRQPFFFASEMFLAALRSARDVRRWTDDTREVTPVPGAPDVARKDGLSCPSSCSAVGRGAPRFREGRGWRGTGAKMVGSVRRSKDWRAGPSYAPDTPVGVLIIKGWSGDTNAWSSAWTILEGSEREREYGY